MSVQYPLRNPLATLCLLIISFLWFLLGLGILLGEATDSTALLHYYMPVWLRIIIWWVPMILGTFLIFTREGIKTILILLSVGPTIRVVSYLWAWFSYLVPGVPEGYQGGWYPAAYHFALLALVLLAAGLTREEKSKEDDAL